MICYVTSFHRLVGEVFCKEDGCLGFSPIGLRVAGCVGTREDAVQCCLSVK